jgi:hypothetical protein
MLASLSFTPVRTPVTTVWTRSLLISYSSVILLPPKCIKPVVRQVGTQLPRTATHKKNRM